MKSKNELFESLIKVIEEHYTNTKLIKDMVNEFRNKGLKSTVPNLVFGDGLDLDKLTTLELICICKVAYEQYQIEALKPSEYFSNGELYEYESYMNVEDNIDSIVLDNCDKDPNGHGFTASYNPIIALASFYDNRMMRWNPETQRQSTYRKVGNSVIRTSTIIESSVKDITELMIKNKFDPNLITINILAMEGKTPQISYNEEKRQLIIKPNFDIESETFTAPDLADGAHRLTSACLAVKKMKEIGKLDELKGTLHVMVTMKTADECREFIKIQNMQNKFDSNYIKSLSNDSYMKFARMITETGDSEGNIFYNNVANTWEEIGLLNKITDYTIIADAVKSANVVKVGNPFDVKFKSKTLVEIVTSALEYVGIQKELNDEGIKNSIYTKPYTMAMWLLVAQRLMNNKNYLDDLIVIVDKIIEMENELENTKPGYKGCTIGKMNKFLNSVYESIDKEVKANG